MGSGGNLSGNANIPQLIINTVRTLEDIYERDDDFRFSKKVLYKTILGKHYARLAYYYLSELDRANARKYALYSMKYRPLLLKTITTLLLSLAPLSVLDYSKQIKRKVRGFWN
jgi:hypothetical protein